MLGDFGVAHPLQHLISSSSLLPPSLPPYLNVIYLDFLGLDFQGFVRSFHGIHSRDGVLNAHADDRSKGYKEKKRLGW